MFGGSRGRGLWQLVMVSFRHWGLRCGSPGIETDLGAMHTILGDLSVYCAFIVFVCAQTSGNPWYIMLLQNEEALR